MPEIIVKLGDHEIQRYPFDKERVTIGRAKDNDIVIDNLNISRYHAEIQHNENCYVVADRDSANGTYVNGARVESKELASEDVVSIGKHRLLVRSMIQADFGPDNGNICFLTINFAKRRSIVFPLLADTIVIGRSAENDLRLIDWFVDPIQLRLEKNEAGYCAVNLPSMYPASLNGHPFEAEQLENGDVIEVGTTQLVFAYQDSAPIEKAESDEYGDSKASEMPAGDEDLHFEQDLPEGDPEESAPGENSLPDEEDSEKNDLPLNDSEENVPALDELDAMLQESQMLPEERENADLASSEAESADVVPPPSPAPEQLIKVLERALENKSLAVRKHAALQLSKLTGRAYDVE